MAAVKTQNLKAVKQSAKHRLDSSRKTACGREPKPCKLSFGFRVEGSGFRAQGFRD